MSTSAVRTGNGASTFLSPGVSLGIDLADLSSEHNDHCSHPEDNRPLPDSPEEGHALASVDPEEGGPENSAGDPEIRQDGRILPNVS